MRVVYISNGNIPSKWAHTFQVMKMAEALAAQVDRLELVTSCSMLTRRPNCVDLHRWYGVARTLRIVRLPVRTHAPADFFTHVYDPRFDRFAVRYARWRRPDLVYSRSIGAAAGCVAHGIETLLETHLGSNAPQHRILGEIARSPALRGLVTVTNALRDDWVAAGVPAERIHVWPDAVDLERFEGLASATEERARHGLPREGPLVVYCGHFYPAKGVETLVEAARLLPKATVLLVGGWPEDVARLRERARGCERVRFADFVPNERVPATLAAADVLVLPNSARFREAHTTSPLKLFEYMAARRPIVATRIPALDGLLVHGRNAWVVAPDSPEALADGIERVLTDPELAARLAAQAECDVRRYTWKRRAADLLAVARAPVAPLL